MNLECARCKDENWIWLKYLEGYICLECFDEINTPAHSKEDKQKS